MDTSTAQAALVQLLRQAAACGASPTETASERNGTSSHDSSFCSETDQSNSQPDLSAILQAIVTASNLPPPENERRPVVYSSVPGWDSPIPAPGETDFGRYKAHLDRHVPGFVYFEKEDLKRTRGKGRSGRSYFCRQIRRTIADHGITGERHINIDRAVDQVLLYCPAIERTLAEREVIKKRIGNSLNCQRRHQKFKRAGESYVKGPCKRRGEKKDTGTGEEGEHEPQDAPTKRRRKSHEGKTWKLGDKVELLSTEKVVVGYGILVMLEVTDKDTQEVNDVVGGVQVTEKTLAGEEEDYQPTHVSWELHSNLRWAAVEIGNIISWDYVNLRHKEKDGAVPAPLQLQRGQWVAVAYDDDVYVGQVDKVSRKGNPTVNYLEFVEESEHVGHYKWPMSADVHKPNPDFMLMIDVPVIEGTTDELFTVPCHRGLKIMYEKHMGNV